MAGASGQRARVPAGAPASPSRRQSPPRRPRPAPERGRERGCILAVDDAPQTLPHVRDALAEAGSERNREPGGADVHGRGGSVLLRPLVWFLSAVDI